MPSSLGSLVTRKRRDVWSDVKHWRTLCPILSISEDASCVGRPVGDANATICNRPTPEASRRCERLIGDGYALVDNLTGDAICSGSDENNNVSAVIDCLSSAITSLHKQHGLPATFALLFDETWQLAQTCSRVLSESTHANNSFNFDMLAWYVDPKEGMAGFSPHRDRQPDVAKDTFHNDGQAKYVTLWLALSDATPENSCLYVIPKRCDPGYTDGDEDGESEKADTDEADPLQRALNSKESYQNIRALPRCSGQAVLFTHRIMHWGSRGNADNEHSSPRIAISFVSSDPSFEAPYIDPCCFTGSKIPPFEIRMLLCCAQLIIYHERFEVPKESIRACYEYVKELETKLDVSYRKKVFVEFVKAMKEDSEASCSRGVASSIRLGDEGDDNISGDGKDKDEEDEAVLEEMLDAEAGGYGEFQDDFDDIDDGGNDSECFKEDEDGYSSSDEEQGDDKGGCLLFGKRKSEDDHVRSSSKKLK
uniref:Phytanoyl-CoA dioxygenase n=1 Tax=Odontella aurita TaxID=265563 RepID=A0A7S4JIH2_9STRA|mmetsp:Transcript_46691/g.141460  ORF Transcript_46691/g.141460 Transcript_46691/m.141460 type:complete len:479 (+) Transcript_46691:174-1610(+)